MKNTMPLAAVAATSSLRAAGLGATRRRKLYRCGPPDPVVDCDYPPPEYRERCLEKGFTPVEPPRRMPEEEAAVQAAGKAQTEEKAARVEAGSGRKTIEEMAEEKAAAGKEKARLPGTGGTYPGVAALAGLGSLFVVGTLLARKIFC